MPPYRRVVDRRRRTPFLGRGCGTTGHGDPGRVEGAGRGAEDAGRGAFQGAYHGEDAECDTPAQGLIGLIGYSY